MSKRERKEGRQKYSNESTQYLSHRRSEFLLPPADTGLGRDRWEQLRNSVIFVDLNFSYNQVVLAKNICIQVICFILHPQLFLKRKSSSYTASYIRNERCYDNFEPIYTIQQQQQHWQVRGLDTATKSRVCICQKCWCLFSFQSLFFISPHTKPINFAHIEKHHRSDSTPRAEPRLSHALCVSFLSADVGKPWAPCSWLRGAGSVKGGVQRHCSQPGKATVTPSAEEESTVELLYCFKRLSTSPKFLVRGFQSELYVQLLEDLLKASL